MGKHLSRQRTDAPEEELRVALQDKIIPWLEADAVCMILAEPPLHPPAGIEVAPREKPLLKPGKIERLLPVPQRTVHWWKQGLVAPSNSVIAFVLEGSADLELGVTEKMAALDSRLDPRHGRMVLRLPARSFLALPPGIPRPDGMRAHWESGVIAPEQAASGILWINLLVEGVMLHTCHTRGQTHTSSPRHFILDPQLLRIGELLFEQMQTPDAPQKIARAHLLALMLRIEHAIATDRALSGESGPHAAPGQAADIALPQTRQTANAAILDRTCRYIDSHLTQPLTGTLVAHHSFSSVSHLNRIFQAEFGIPVMKFVERRRMEMAQTLLTTTHLPISAISAHLSYRHIAHFSLVFKRVVGVSPSQYRQNQRSPKDAEAPPKKTGRKS